MKDPFQATAEWLLIVSLIVTPVKGKPATIELLRMTVQDRLGCKIWGDVAREQYMEIRKRLHKSKRKFPNVRTYAYRQNCVPKMEGGQWI